MALTLKENYVALIDSALNSYMIDLKELGNDTLNSPYRNFRTRNCNCWGLLSPEEEMEWHVSHIKMRLTSFNEIQSFYEQFYVLIKREGKTFGRKKWEVVNQLKTKAREKGLEFWEINKKENSGNYLYCSSDIIFNKDLSNSKMLETKEREWVKEIEKISSSRTQAKQAQQKEREENEAKRQKEREEWEKKTKQDKEKWEEDQKESEEQKKIEEDKKRQQDKELDSQKQKEEEKILQLTSLIKDCRHLATLEEKYQTVKNNPLYTSSKWTFVRYGGENNKTLLDNFYTRQKTLLQSKHQKDNSPTNQQQRPQLIDTTKIEQAENIDEAIAVTKTQITQTLKKHNLKTTDLPKKYHNWEEQLSKLTTREQINYLVAEINQQTEIKLKELKDKKNQKNNNKQQSPQPFSLTTKLLIGGGVIILIIFTFLLISKVKRERKK